MSSRLVRIAEGLYGVDTVLTLQGNWLFPARMTLWRDSAGGVVLHSPIAIDDALAAEIATLGPVRNVIAPNKVHSLFYGAARARYPKAHGYGAPGLAEKRPKLVFDATLSDVAPKTLLDVESTHLRGVPGIEEVVFLHRPTRTLVCTDLVFQILEPPGPASAIFLTLMGASKRFAQSRAWKMLVRDEKALRESLDRVLAWDFDRIVMAHGVVLESDGPAKLREAVAWVAE